MLDKLTQNDFSKYLNEQFQVHIEDDKVIECELIQVNELGSGRSTQDVRSPFSLIFRGPKEVQLNQGIWKLTHTKMGIMEIFLVPLGPDDEGMLYEAVFA